MEQEITGRGQHVKDLNLDALETEWQKAKATTKGPKDHDRHSQ